MTSTIAPTKQIIMSDMFTDVNFVDKRRFKVDSKPSYDNPSTTSFGETATAPLTPIVQISAQYGKEDDLNIINSAGGSYTIENSLYKVSSGTSPIGLSSLNANL